MCETFTRVGKVHPRIMNKQTKACDVWGFNRAVRYTFYYYDTRIKVGFEFLFYTAQNLISKGSIKESSCRTSLKVCKWHGKANPLAFQNFLFEYWQVTMSSTKPLHVTCQCQKQNSRRFLQFLWASLLSPWLAKKVALNAFPVSGILSTTRRTRPLEYPFYGNFSLCRFEKSKRVGQYHSWNSNITSSNH